MSIFINNIQGKIKEDLRINKYFFKGANFTFKKKSANSLRAAQEFAIDQDLVFYDLGLEAQNNLVSNPDQYILVIISLRHQTYYYQI